MYFSQATVVTFSCPMRFDLYPLDAHTCKFRIESTNLDMSRMIFNVTQPTYDETKKNTILDYQVSLNALKEKDRILQYGELGNFSITGIEIIFTRHKLKYMYMFYLPSGNYTIYMYNLNIICSMGFQKKKICQPFFLKKK